MALQLRRLRAAAVALVLAALVIWPAAHRYLQPAVDFDCWKFFGFAMYAVPTPRFYVSIEDPYEPGRVEVTPPDQLRPSLRRFGFEALAMGRWVDVEPFAAELLTTFPNTGAVRIRHERTWLRSGVDRVGLWVRYWDVVRLPDGGMSITASEDEIAVDWIARGEVAAPPGSPPRL